MPGLVPGIHVFLSWSKTWMAGTSPAMTISTHLNAAPAVGFLPPTYTVFSGQRQRSLIRQTSQRGERARQV
jgi:hypothetical protein